MTDTALAAYTGNAVNSLTLVTNNDDVKPPEQRSLIRVPVTVGQVIHIQIANGPTVGGDQQFTLRWYDSTSYISPPASLNAVATGIATTNAISLKITDPASGTVGKYPGTQTAQPPSVRAVGPWKFWLANSKDMSPIGEFTQAKSKSLTLGLNQAGSASFQVSMNDPLSYKIRPVETCVLAIRDDIVRWSGMVWTVDETLPSRQVNVTAIGWFEVLNHRFLKTTGPSAITQDLIWRYTDTDTDPLNGLYRSNAGNIAGHIINLMNQQYPSFIKVGTIDPDQPNRSLTYERLSFRTIGQVIQQFAEVEDGFDWTINPVSREISFWGAAITDLSSTVAFGYGWGPENLVSARRTFDPSQLVNWMFVRGKYGAALIGDGASGPETEAFTSQNRFGMFQEAPTLNDVVDPTVLLAYAGEEILVRSNPRVIYEITPRQWKRTNSTPRLFDDYNVGDIVTLMIKSGTIQMNRPQRIRIFGLTVSIDEEGNEKIENIQTTATT